MEDGEENLKSLERAQHIYTCRNKPEDKEEVFNFGPLAYLKLLNYLKLLKNLIFEWAWIGLARLARDKRSSLFGVFVNAEEKKVL